MPHTLLHLMRQLDEPRRSESLGYVLQVFLDLVAGSVQVGPVRVGREGELVGVGGDVAGDAFWFGWI